MPPEAKDSGLSGTVMVDASIAPDGTVEHTIALGGPKEMQSAAAAAVKQWKFEPTVLNGRGVYVYATFAVPVGQASAPNP